VSAEEDLIEEVGRMHGYERIPEEVRVRPAPQAVRAAKLERQWDAREMFLSSGLTEVVTPGLVDGAAIDRDLPADEFLSAGAALRNPLSSDRDRLRGSLVPGLLQVLAANRAQSISDLAIFEVGQVFHTRGEEFLERSRAGILLAGSRLTSSWMGKTEVCDFFDMKGIVEVYVERLGGGPLRLEAASFSPLTADQSARAFVDGIEIGRLGDIGAKVRKSYDLPEGLPVFWAELDLEWRGADEAGQIFFEPLPRFPAALRDLAFVVPRSVASEDLERIAAEASGSALESIRLFDVYEGPPLEAGEKSLAYTLVFRVPERSLASKEVDALVHAIVTRANQKTGARLR
jgi:phenylalanyl-tRNA synthetase beta chain